MTQPLMLDDYGMMLLSQLDEAYGDWQAVYEHGEHSEPEMIEITGADGPVGSLTLAPTDTRERGRIVDALTRDFVAHVYLLDQNRDVPAVRAFDKHITLEPSDLMIIHRAHVYREWALAHVRQRVIPLHRTFKARQDKKAAWLKGQSK